MPSVDVAVEVQPAGLQHEHPVAHRAHRGGRVADVEDRGAVAADLLHLGHALLLERPVPHREHLVGEEHVGIDVDGDREAQPRVHARGVVRDRRVHELADVGELDDGVELALGLGLAHPEDRPVEEEVLAPGQLRVETGPGGDQPGDPAAGADRALVGPHHAVDQLEQGALARPVQPHQADGLTLLDVEGDVVDGKELLLQRQSSHRGDGHLLEGAVVLHREHLRHVAHLDRNRHHIRSGNLFSTREKNFCAPHSSRPQAAERDPAHAGTCRAGTRGAPSSGAR